MANWWRQATPPSGVSATKALFGGALRARRKIVGRVEQRTDGARHQKFGMRLLQQRERALPKYLVYFARYLVKTREAARIDDCQFLVLDDLKDLILDEPLQGDGQIEGIAISKILETVNDRFNQPRNDVSDKSAFLFSGKRVEPNGMAYRVTGVDLVVEFEVIDIEKRVVVARCQNDPAANGGIDRRQNIRKFGEEVAVVGMNVFEYREHSSERVGLYEP